MGKKRVDPAEKSVAAQRRVDQCVVTYNFEALEEKYHLSSGMLRALCLIESEGKTNAVSTKQCAGLMQLSVDAAREVGIVPKSAARMSDAQVVECLKQHPDKNVLGAAKYIDKYARIMHAKNEALLAEGKGLSADVLGADGRLTPEGTMLMAAAYNAGPPRMKGYMTTYGDDWYAKLPNYLYETHNYVLDVSSFMALERPRTLAVPSEAASVKEAAAAWNEARRIAEVQVKIGETAPEQMDEAFRASKVVVRAIQQPLQPLGAGKADGIAGRLFDQALAKAETREGFVADGKISLDEIGQLLAPKLVPSAPPKPVSKGKA